MFDETAGDPAELAPSLANSSAPPISKCVSFVTGPDHQWGPAILVIRSRALSRFRVGC
jgi:hypothetical protein